MKKNVIFDMDGVLLDTEKLKAKAHVEVLAQEGGNAAECWYEEVIGLSFSSVASLFLSRAGKCIGLIDYKQRYNLLYRELVADIRYPNDGVVKLLQLLKAKQIKCAVVTSSKRGMMELLLKNTGIIENFDCFVCSEDVSKEKPDPEPYKTAISCLGAMPSECVAVEDTIPGIASASSAGLDVIAVRHDFNKKLNLSEAVLEVKTLRDFPLNILWQK